MVVGVGSAVHLCVLTDRPRCPFKQVLPCEQLHMVQTPYAGGQQICLSTGTNLTCCAL